MSKNRKFNIPAVAIVDNIIFSKKEVWAYYKISTVPFDFLSESAQASLANRTNVALSTLAQKADKKVDAHILITSTPFETSNWVEQMKTNYKQWNEDLMNAHYFEEFINSQAKTLEGNGFKKKVTYLGVKINTRGAFSLENFNVLEFGFKEAWEALKKGIDNTFRLTTTEASDYEIENAKGAEADIYLNLTSSSLRVSRPTSEELLLLNKRILHPAMPTAYLEVDHENRIGLNDITFETSRSIEDKHRYLKVTQLVDGVEYTGYRATMSFARFPVGMGAPSNVPPFLYFSHRIGAPFTLNARFSLIPTEEMKKELAHKKLETDDEISNLQNSGQASNAHIQETLQNLNQLDEELKDSRFPWVSGSYRITIEQPTVEDLNMTAAELKQIFAESDFALALTSGDQMQLLYEEFPGGELRVNSFSQRTNLSMIGTSGFNYGSEVGDPVKETLTTKRR